VNLLNRKELYNDGVGFVEGYDFSTANTSKESRIEAITKVASVCYDKEAKNKIALFNMLESESIGLPSSAFEFVPVLIPQLIFSELVGEIYESISFSPFTTDLEKYGTWINKEDDEWYLLTNLRACLSTQKNYNYFESIVDFKTYFNTSPKEIQIIKDNFKVFFSKIPLFVRSQMVRHRASFQELSRRYTDNERSLIEFYLKDKNPYIKRQNYKSLNLYENLIRDGVKPEDARAVLPQATYTKIWSAFLPYSYDNFIKLRTKKNAQSEIRDLAEAMKELVCKH